MTTHEVGSTIPRPASESFWEPHYQRNIRPWSGLPNAVLADITADLTPGSVLDIGCGEGGDALWLAGRGWTVTAVDVSATVLERARSQAAEQGLTANVTFEKCDVSQSLPGGSFDLVSAQYFHTPIDIPREQVLRRAAESVATQGLLLIVDHASTAPWSWNQDPDVRFPTPQDTLKMLDLDDDHWQPIRVKAAQRTASGPDGQTATVTDNVIALRRTDR
ncbi:MULTISPECIES: class I SAM-dependent methyltransferase [unclassified Rhodococcus (in: high G+C Gram-positive bacteria)]|uniref:class I SAM-dependent methyltransferase n=1 Tax=unclassified Rhodococcus (in: high G+C Gram-positive bacteria) TaxID=192944 RepID=UPI001FF8328B|nr:MULTISPECIES: class I SAM-dependent methyltransferase [unclassified Rhodococcus (in: high G+C Gram-positive bacteria)]